MDYLTLSFGVAIGAALVSMIAAITRRPQPWPPTNPGAVYMRCKDCGREHAVYPDGKAHALREADESERAAWRKQPPKTLDPQPQRFDENTVTEPFTGTSLQLPKKEGHPMGEAGGRPQSPARPPRDQPRCEHHIPLDGYCTQCAALGKYHQNPPTE